MNKQLTAIDHPHAGAPTSDRTRASMRRKARVVAVSAAPAAALLVWAMAKLLGMDVQSPVFDPAQGSWDIGAGMVMFTATLASLAGWGALALLERLTARARTIWTVGAILVALFSLIMPLTGTDVSGGNRAALLLMHVAVAGVLIPLLRRTSRRRPTA